MANTYANLGTLNKKRGDMAEACLLRGEALKLYEEIGAADRVAQTRELMDEAGCDKLD